MTAEKGGSAPNAGIELPHELNAELMRATAELATRISRMGDRIDMLRQTKYRLTAHPQRR